MMVWLRRPIHASWLIAAVALGVVMGVVWAPRLAGFAAGLLAAVGFMLMAFKVSRYWALPLALFAGIMVGGARAGLELVEYGAYHQFIGKDVTISGVVTEDLDIGRRGEPILRLGEVESAGVTLPGTVWVSLSNQDSRTNIQRSDRVTIDGRMSQGFGSFGASVHRASVSRVERPVPGDVALRLRDWFADSARQVIPEPAASLGIGYLTGQRRALPEELDESLRIAGLTHVVVASGYNLTILVRLSRRLFARLSKFLAASVAGGMVVAFIAVTGMSPSMSRAGLVSGLSLLAWYYGRRLHPLVLLPLAAAITLLINPSYGWGDLGWQLSFAAFAGVLIVSPLVQAYFFGDDKPGVLRQIFGETLAAQLVTLPIIAATFGMVSNVSLLANMAVLPLVPLAMLLTFIAGIASWLVPMVADWIAQPAVWLLTYMTESAQWLAGLSWAETELELGPWLAPSFYVLLAGLCIYMNRQTKGSLKDHNLVE